MTSVEHLEAAVRELAEAKRLAELYNRPQSAIDRIDLLKRGTANMLSQMRRKEAA